jgi:hypothetical protein
VSVGDPEGRADDVRPIRVVALVIGAAFGKIVAAPVA